MKEICTLLVKLHIIFSRMQRVNQHARPSIIQVGCPTCCYQVCALDHANVGTADLDYNSGPCHRNAVNWFNARAFQRFYDRSKLSMARLPWHIKQHRVNITERLYSGNCVWRSQFFNHSAPLPPGGHRTHYPTHSGPGTLSVPTPAREACATFHWPETYRKQRSTNKPTPQSETTPS